MSAARILVVDDSVISRKVLSSLIEKEPGLELAGVAPNGKIALQKIPQLAPDLVILDIEMPDMSGLETLAEIRKESSTLPVIMFSSLAKTAAAQTMEALRIGASDYLAKPSQAGSGQEAVQQIKDQLIPKIRALCAVPATTSEVPPKPKPITKTFAERISRIDILAIGVSTGGPNALGEIIPKLPADLPVPVLIIQHMPPQFTSQLASSLDNRSQLSVYEAKEGDKLKPGGVWIAPGDYHMVLTGSRLNPTIQLNQDMPENSCRPAVDVTFRSVAKTYGKNTLAIILTGMGKDGLEGSKLIHEQGGQIYAQDEASCVVWGMPKFVTEAGLADKVIPLQNISSELTRRITMKQSPQHTVAQ